jgi:hypothetical protein
MWAAAGTADRAFILGHGKQGCRVAPAATLRTGGALVLSVAPGKPGLAQPASATPPGHAERLLQFLGTDRAPRSRRATRRAQCERLPHV